MPKQATARIEPADQKQPRQSISPEVSEVLNLIGTMERLAHSAAAEVRAIKLIAD